MTLEPTADANMPSFDVRDAVLVVSSASGVTTFSIPSGKIRLLVGRAPTCDVPIDDPSVSREHAALVLIGNELHVEDLGSRNKTRVRGRPLARGETVRVELGAVVELGTAALALQRRPTSSPAPVPRKEPSAPAPTVVLDPAMRSLYGLLDVVAPSTLAVLVLGETGTGKEVVAEAIHARSPRASAPLLRVNCAGLAGSLLESELFGHEKGAFTGAVAAKVGLFEAADGGTLFLDEIGEMPLETQAKVLRAIETGEVTRLGTTRPKKVDVRYVAATHRDLHAMIQEGTFRADLYFRLAGFSMTLPPLRKRTSEIVPLARTFLARGAGARPASLSPAAEAALLAHPWPGNIRELKNVVERALVLSGGSAMVEVEHLLDPGPHSAPGPSSNEVPAAVSVSAPPPSDDDGLDFRARRDAWERTRIEEVLASVAWSQKKAAEVLGFTVRTLQNKISALGIVRPPRSR